MDRKTKALLWLSASFLMLVVTPQAFGQVQPPAGDSVKTTVIGAANYRGGRDSAIVGMDNYLKITVQNLARLVRQIPEDGSLILYLDNVPMRGIKPLFIDTCNGIVVFKLARDSVSFNSWAVFYQTRNKHIREMKVSLGIAGQCPVSSKGTLTVVLMRKSLLYGCLVGFAMVVILLINLAVKTNIIRNENSGEARTYSLARSQLALWTVLIVFAYLYLWAATGYLPLINSSILILLSISMGTAAGASIIDYSQKDNIPSGKSQGFLIDILSDRNGVSIHRFQMVVWTVFFGFFFYRSVVQNLAMPMIDDNLLALMGISNGAYLGLKIPENKQDQMTTPPAESGTEIKRKMGV